MSTLMSTVANVVFYSNSPINDVLLPVINVAIYR